MEFNYEIIESKMETKKALLNHLLILIPHLNINDNKKKSELIKLIKLKSDLKINFDNFPPVIYLILLLIGSEIFKKDKNLESNLDFFLVLSYFNKLSMKQKLILNEIFSDEIFNYFKFRNSLDKFDLDLILEKLKFKYSVYFILKNVINEIIEN